MQEEVENRTVNLAISTTKLTFRTIVNGYMDEFHLLLKEEQTAAYSVEIWKRFRKWGGIPTGITQNVKDLLSSREVTNIFENSDFIYMLNQAAGDRQILADQLNISPHQLSYVTHSGEGEGLLFYDEYRYNLAEIGHNPYELASLLTVEFENYTRSQVQARLQSIFDAQYELKLEEKVEIRTRKETRVGYSYNPITGTGHTYTYQVTVQYEYKILNVTLLNRGVDYVARNSGLTDDQLQRYEVTLECRGNRDDLFAGIAFATPDGAGSSGEYQDYDIPGEALTDEKFRKMITEAEKYLGYPYVWGGSSPSTSFDCSGFVSWVINHCGNGWNVGRQTANGLMGKCDIIPKSEAKPGDLIFFQKTYNTSGASHVGIYVGNGMMIHCGNPISYASIETNYWRQHYYCMGRIR